MSAIVIDDYIDLIETFLTVGFSSGRSAACANEADSGTIEYAADDADQSASLSDGDVIVVKLTNCRFQAGGTVLSGTKSYLVVRVNGQPTGEFVVGGVTQYTDFFAKSATSSDQNVRFGSNPFVAAYGKSASSNSDIRAGLAWVPDKPLIVTFGEGGTAREYRFLELEGGVSVSGSTATPTIEKGFFEFTADGTTLNGPLN